MNYRNRSLFFLPLLILTLHLQGQTLLNYKNNQSLSWEQSIRYYSSLDRKYPEAKLEKAGTTDSGKPLHLFLISGNQRFAPHEAREDEKIIILLNNGIHPGEPCGIDASAKLARDILTNQEKYHEILDNTLIAIIPVLNVGGALNRGKYFRANQNGPEYHGFRGNAINMDLNRDFIKLDTKNAISMVKIMRKWDPDILIDTHTSNGSDYSYVLTLISTQENKLNPPLSGFLYRKMLPSLYQEMGKSPYELIPYVMSLRYPDPKNGIMSFMDYPRYTTGYASLYHTIGFTTEAHMFKPFEDRVLATWTFINKVLWYATDNKKEILITRKLTREQNMGKQEFILKWEPDTSDIKSLWFKGYEIEYKTSKLSGQERYLFNREKTWEKEIPWLTQYKAVKTVQVPDFYVIPQSWSRVIERLDFNNIQYSRLRKDTSLFVEYYNIDSYKTRNSPYNGHYKHSDLKLTQNKGYIKYYQGDIMVPVRQPGIEYIVQVLEPEGEDSFFSWNFFDSILSRKEYFSPYVFEEKALELLEKNPKLAEEFHKEKRNNPTLRDNHYAQLKFIYERSPYSEAGYKRYPVTRYFLEDK